MNPKLVIFDLDGTICDSKEGIFFSYRHVADALGKPQPTTEELQNSLRGSFQSNIQRLFDLEIDEVQEAVSIYRDDYSMRGETMVVPFDHILDVIHFFNFNNITVSIATLKIEEFAVEQMRAWGIEDSFRSICGADREGFLTKTDLIRRCLRESDTDPEEAVMIGDSPDDLRSARECGVPFVGAAYGYSLPAERCTDEDIPFALTPSDIPEVIRKLRVR